MARSRVDMLRTAIEAWNREDLDATLALLTADFEWRPTGTFPGADPVYRGGEGFRRFWDQFHEAWEYVEIEMRRVTAHGDIVIAETTFHAKGAGSGVEVDLDLASVFTFRGDLACRGAAYLELEQALQDAGLTPDALEPAEGPE